MNLADVALEALYVLGVLMCCALLSREEDSREGLGSRRARLFMLALAVVFCFNVCSTGSAVFFRSVG